MSKSFCLHFSSQRRLFSASLLRQYCKIVRQEEGGGVQEAAMASINLPLAVALPRLYSELHIYFYEKYNIMYAPLVFTGLMHVLVSEVVAKDYGPHETKIDGVNRKPCKMILEYKISFVTEFDSPLRYYEEQKSPASYSCIYQSNHFVGACCWCIIVDKGGVHNLILVHSSIMIFCIIMLLCKYDLVK